MLLFGGKFYVCMIIMIIYILYIIYFLLIFIIKSRMIVKYFIIGI